MTKIAEWTAVALNPLYSYSKLQNAPVQWRKLQNELQ
jgi:hypothetical protein